MRWLICAKHDGRHLNIYGQCVNPGAPVAIRIGPCPTCDLDVAFSRNLASGRVTVLEEGSDARHAHPLPLRVELDCDELVLGIAGGLEILQQQRREQRAAARERDSKAYAYESPLNARRSTGARGGEKAPLGGIPEFDA